MKSYTLRPDTFTLNFNFTLSGTMAMTPMTGQRLPATGNDDDPLALFGTSTPAAGMASAAGGGVGGDGGVEVVGSTSLSQRLEEGARSAIVVDGEDYEEEVEDEEEMSD
jgi:hypothetical protein